MYNFPYHSNNVIFFGYARTALEYGFEYLGFKAGDEVLYPEYICDVAMVPSNNIGIKVMFYKVKGNLEPDFGSISGLLTKKTKALMSVNYFGFMQDMDKAKDFCRENNLHYIEDSAHSFLSKKGNKVSGSFGDISILSFRKMIPSVNGAALVINRVMNEDIIDDIRKKSSSLALEKNRIKRVKSFIHRIESEYSIPLSRLRKRQLTHLPHGYSENEDLSYCMDPESLKVLKDKNWNKEIARRRRKYGKWVSLLGPLGAIPVFGELKEDTVPMACPVFSSDRDKLLKYLLGRGVKATTWPTLPLWVSKNSSNALDIWSRLILLPI